MVSYGGGVLDSFVIDFVLLFIAAFTVRARISGIGLLFAAGIGGGFALAFPHLNLSYYYLLSVRLIITVIMCLCATKKMTARQFLLYYLIIPMLH